MLKIHGVYRSRAFRNIWFARELGIPYEVVPVIQAYRLAARAPGIPVMNTRSPEFMRLNPLGQIPAIEDGDVVLTESLAINLYLARKHGGPLTGQTLAEEGQMLRWSFWAATEMEANALAVLMQAESGDVTGGLADAAREAEASLRDKLPVLNQALSATGWLVGGRFTVADLNVAEVLRYALPATSLFADNPAVKSWLEACHARPAFRELWAKRTDEVT